MPSNAAAAVEHDGHPVSVELQGARRTYGRGGQIVAALDDVDLAVRAGELTLILGPSGCGKSTLLHLMGGMDRPTHGRVLSGGEVTSELTADRLAAWRRTCVGFVFQAFHLLAHRTALENVALPLALGGVPPRERRRRAQELLARVGLADRAGHRPAELSGGQAQRVAIARALAADPSIVLADEPTGNLDRQGGLEIFDLLVDLAHRDGRTVVVVSHNEEFAARADRVVRVLDGRVVADSAPDVGPCAPAGPVRHAGGGPAAATLLGMAVSAVRRRLGRSLLTGTGVAIGVTAMVLLMSIGAGLRQQIVGSVLAQAALTSVMVTSSAAPTGISFGPSVATGGGRPLGPAQVRELARLTGVRAAYPDASLFGTLRAAARSTTGVVRPLPPARLWSPTGTVSLPRLLAGRLPSTTTTAAGSGVVLPQSMADALFSLRPGSEAAAVGRSLTLSPTGTLAPGGQVGAIGSGTRRTRTLTVTGVSSNVLGSPAAYVRASVLMRWLAAGAARGSALRYPDIVVLARRASDVAGVARRVRALGFGATTVGDVLHTVTRAFRVVEVGLGAVGGIALAVAGLMIAVVMSMAVLERTREIGVLRAIGARRRDVFTLFVVEAGLLGLAGGAVGDALGWGVGSIGAAALKQPHLVLVSPGLALLGLAFGVGVAVLAGAVPAGRAAGLSPVEALRGE